MNKPSKKRLSSEHWKWKRLLQYFSHFTKGFIKIDHTLSAVLWALSYVHFICKKTVNIWVFHFPLFNPFEFNWSLCWSFSELSSFTVLFSIDIKNIFQLFPWIYRSKLHCHDDEKREKQKKLPCNLFCRRLTEFYDAKFVLLHAATRSQYKWNQHEALKLLCAGQIKNIFSFKGSTSFEWKKLK